MKAASLLSPRSVIVFCAIVLIGLNGLVLFLVWEGKAQALRRGEDEAALQHQVFAAYAAQTLHGYDYIAMDLVNRRLPEKPEAADAEMRRLKAIDPMLMDLQVVSADGRIRYWSGTGNPPEVTDRDFFAVLHDNPRRDLYVSPAHLSRVHPGEWCFSLSRPVRGASGEFDGAVVVIVTLKAFNRDLAGIVSVEGTRFAMRLDDGQTVTRLPDTQETPSMGPPPPPEALQAPQSGATRFRTFLSSGETHDFSIFQYLPEYGVWVVTTTGYERSLQLWESSAWRMLSILGVSNLLMIGAAAALVGAARRNASQFAVMRNLAARLETQATHDPLTDVFNRRHFDTLATVEIERMRRQKTELCLLLFDIDHFKRVNDERGHQQGDLVLQAIAGAAQRSLRETDILARFGGEEFVILLPHTDLEQAGRFAERLRKAFEDLFGQPGSPLPWPVTVSFGIARIRPEESSYEAAFHRVDLALYHAKMKGRNRVECEPEEREGS